MSSACARSLLALGTLLVAGELRGDQEGRLGPYRIESADGRFFFVMAQNCRSGGRDARPESVEGFSQSGLYRKDDTAKPIWTVNWCGSVRLPSDGIHLVRTGPWASWGEDEALSLFANGQLLRTYRVKDLVDWPALLPASVSHFEWRHRLEAEGGDAVYPLAWQPTEETDRPSPISGRRHAESIRVSTLQGDSFVVALDSGEILSSSRPLRLVLLVLSLLAALGYVVVLTRASSRAQPSLKRRLLDLAWWTTVGTWALVTSSLALGSIFDPLATLFFRAELLPVFVGGLALVTIVSVVITGWRSRNETENTRQVARRVVTRAVFIAWTLAALGIWPILTPRAFPVWSDALARAAFRGVLWLPLGWIEEHGLRPGRGLGIGAADMFAIYLFWLPIGFVILSAHSVLSMILARARGQRSAGRAADTTSLIRSGLWLVAQLATCAGALWLAKGLSLDGPTAGIAAGATTAGVYLVSRSARRALGAID